EHTVERIDVADRANDEDALVTDLDLDPDTRRALPVSRSGILRHQSFIPTFHNDVPRLAAILRQAPARQEEVDIVDEILKHAPTLDERLTSKVPCTDLKHVENDENRGRGNDAATVVIQQMEPAHELLIEDGDFTVQNSDVGFEVCDRSGQIAEPPGMVDPVSGDQPDAATILVGEHAPPVALLLVDPAVSMKRRTGKRRRHWDQRYRDDKHRQLLSERGQLGGYPLVGGVRYMRLVTGTPSRVRARSTPSTHRHS